MQQARLHGRGGQGTVKAADILVAAAVGQGLYANAIPYFGFERRGAPVTAFVRLDHRPIRPKTQVYHPDAVVVLDSTLVEVVDVLEGANAGSLVVLNVPSDEAQRVVQRLDAKRDGREMRLMRFDASRISREILGRPIPNTTMLGAFVRASGWLDMTYLVRQVERFFGPANVQAAWAGYREVEAL